MKSVTWTIILLYTNVTFRLFLNASREGGGYITSSSVTKITDCTFHIRISIINRTVTSAQAALLAMNIIFHGNYVHYTNCF